MMDVVYEHANKKIYWDGKHYIMDSKEDVKILVSHLQETLYKLPKYSEEYKKTRRLYCDLFLKGFGYNSN